MSNGIDKPISSDDITVSSVVMANDRDVIDRSHQCVLYYTNSHSVVDHPTSSNTHPRPSTVAAAAPFTANVGGRVSDVTISNDNTTMVQTFTISGNQYGYNDDGTSDEDDDEEEEDDGDDLNDIDDCGDYDDYSGVKGHDAGHEMGSYGSSTRLDDALVACGSSAAAVDIELSSPSSSCRHGIGDDRVHSSTGGDSATGASCRSAIVFVGGSRRVQQAGGIEDDLIEDNNESYFDSGSSGLGRFRRQRGGGSQQQLVGGGSWSSSFGDVRWTTQSTASSILSCCCCCCRNGDGSYGSSARSSIFGRCIAGCVRSRPCLFFIYVIVVLVLISSCVSLILIGVLVAEPYVRVSSFVNSTCVPVAEPTRPHTDTRDHEPRNATAVTQLSPSQPGRSMPDVILQTCSCGKGCNSKYRCLRIHVRYQQMKDSVTSVILYDDETSLNRQCSFYPPCRSSRLDNEQAVAEYERRFGRLGIDPFPCWYNPADRNEVIQHRRFQLHHVINGVVWSSILFLVSVSFLAFVVRRKNFFRS